MDKVPVRTGELTTIGKSNRIPIDFLDSDKLPIDELAPILAFSVGSQEQRIPGSDGYRLGSINLKSGGVLLGIKRDGLLVRPLDKEQPVSFTKYGDFFTLGKEGAFALEYQHIAWCRCLDFFPFRGCLVQGKKNFHRMIIPAEDTLGSKRCADF